MKDYILLIIIGSLASIGMISILVDMIIGSDYDDYGIIRSSRSKVEQYHDDDENYEDDLIINE
jgi:hypothetical protein